MTRCDWSDLPADQCACHRCKPAVRETVEKTRIKATFTARYHSACDNCDGRIKPDELMGLDDDEDRYCERCLS